MRTSDVLCSCLRYLSLFLSGTLNQDRVPAFVSLASEWLDLQKGLPRALENLTAKKVAAKRDRSIECSERQPKVAKMMASETDTRNALLAYLKSLKGNETLTRAELWRKMMAARRSGSAADELASVAESTGVQ